MRAKASIVFRANTVSVCLMLFGLSRSFLTAAPLHVDNVSGSDTNNGSASAAVRAIQKGINL